MIAASVAVAEENKPKNVHIPSFVFASALLAVGLLAYSQTYAFAWDEGFHLLAAKLIKSGKTPYLDFVFAQTPFNAYWNAAWMRIVGESWRGIQAIDALLTTATTVLAADFLRSRFARIGAADARSKSWSTAILLAVIVLAGSNVDIVEFGTIGQAYALGLLLMMVAFRLTVASVEKDRAVPLFLAGISSGAAAGSTLLTASVAPVLLIWSLFYCAPGKRWGRGVAFVSGVAISLTPLLALFARSPARVIFDVFRYHMFYRRSGWPRATQHDMEIFTSWIQSPQAIILGILALAGLWFVAKKSGLDRGTRAEFYLCGWLALAMGVYVSTAHPTFPQYYIFTVPFLAILAAIGLFAIVKQSSDRDRMESMLPVWPFVALSLLMCFALGRELYDRRDDVSWPKMEELARKVDEVTPAGAQLYADEPIYFLTHRTPPPGNEYLSSHKLRLAPDVSQFVHIVPQPEFDRKIAAGVYDTIQTCEEDDWMKERKLDQIYRQKAEVSDCDVFWDRAARPQK